MQPQTSSNPQYAFRQNRLLELIQSSQVNLLALNPSPSLTYLTGLHFHLSERPVVFIFSPLFTPIAIIPALEEPKLAHLPFAIQAFLLEDDPSTWQGTFKKAIGSIPLTTLTFGIEPRQMRALELHLLEEAAPPARFTPAETYLSELRMHKDQSEIALLKKAVQIAQEAFLATLPLISIGMSERQIANELCVQLLRCGSDATLPFSPIVASGPNSANPHAVPTERTIAPGDLLVLDWGACFHGYISDLTRTLAVGGVQTEMQSLAEIVARANSAAQARVSPGIAAGEVDKAARTIITQAGYGDYFTHRTGHGLGLDGHEAPYIYSNNELELAPGMIFTIEPGIYLPGKVGIRIEDDVLVTPQGVECLSNLPRELITIPS